LENLIKQFGITEEAIPIYINCLGRGYLTFYEIYSLFPNLSIEKFETHINELNYSGLLIKIGSEEPEILEHYLALPPYTPLLNYHNALKDNLSTIGTTILEAIGSVVDQITSIDENTDLAPIQDITEDLEEEALIQKSEIDFFVKDRKILKKIGKIFSNLGEKFKEIAQTQVTNIFKDTFLRELRTAELKKSDEKIIENLFESKLDIINYNIADDLFKIFENDLKQTEKNVVEELNSLFEKRIQIKDLYMNMVTDYEEKIKEIEGLIAKPEVNELGDRITGRISGIIQDFAQRIYDFNLPVEESLQSYLRDNLLPEKNIIQNIWLIKSRTKINEEILNIILNSKEEIVFILPNMKDHLDIEHFQNSDVNLKIKIASSESELNSIVQDFKQMHNFEFKNMKNDNIIALKGDNNHIVIGINQGESDDPLNDFIGIGTNFKPLINILAPIIGLSWNAAK